MNTINLLCPEDAVDRIKNCLPGDSQQMQGIEFDLNGDMDRYDGVVVLQSTSMYRRRVLNCRQGNALLVVREPQDILRMTAGYLDQFDHVLSPNRKIKHKRVHHSQFGQLWTFGHSREALTSMRPPPKTRWMSTVTSTKAVTSGHRQRLDLLHKIQAALPGQLDWYGRGVCEIGDKWDAVAPYRYHLVFENGRWPDYWTEKLTDAYLGFTIPIYIGCTNIQDYFPANAMIQLDSNDPDVVIPRILQLLDVDAYEKSLGHIISARNRILNEYNLFNVLMTFVGNNFDMKSPFNNEIDTQRFKNVAYRTNIRKVLKKSMKKVSGLVGR